MGSSIAWFSTWAHRTAGRPAFPDYHYVSYDYGILEEKSNKFKVDLLPEIKDLIHLEVEKVMKKQKENFDSALQEIQKRVIKLEHNHDDLE